MDDDASCEIESIRRTYIMMAFSSDINLSAAGSMLREIEPCRYLRKVQFLMVVVNL